MTGELSETGTRTVAASGNGAEMTIEAVESIVIVSVERSTSALQTLEQWLRPKQPDAEQHAVAFYSSQLAPDGKDGEEENG